MAQLQKGTTYITGDQVTAANLNALVDSGILTPGAVTDQTAKTVPLAADTILLHSAADTALRKTTMTQLFATPQPLGATTPSSVAATTGTFSSTLGVTGVATLGNGAILGTPASGTVTNLTGTASININGTVGATTPSTGAFTTVSATGLLSFTGFGTNILDSSGTGAQTFRIRNSTAGTGNYSILQFGHSASVDTAGLVSTSTTYTASGAYPQNGTLLYGSQVGGLNLAATDGSGVIRFFAASGTATATINSTGLAVTGTLSASGIATLSGAALVTGVHAPSGSVLRLGDGTASQYSDFVYNNASTSNYGANFQIQSGGSNIFRISRAGRVDGGTSDVIYLGTTTAASLKLQANSATVAEVSTTGLAVTGAVTVTYTYPATGQTMTTNSTSTQSAFVFINPNGTVGTINTAGSATAYNTSSDYRLKNVDGPVVDSGTFIDALKPKVGTWKVDGSKFVGFLAHEFAEVSPLSVSGEKDAVDADGKPVYQSMQASTSEVIANLVAELQSLRKRLAALEAK